MTAELLFHLTFIALIAGCVLACGICAIIEIYTAGHYRRQLRKSRKARARYYAKHAARLRETELDRLRLFNAERRRV